MCNLIIGEAILGTQIDQAIILGNLAVGVEIAGYFEGFEMYTVELLHQAIEIAGSLGYEVREEWLGSAGGGSCEYGGKKWIFLDLAYNPVEQFEQIGEVLCQDPAIHLIELPDPLRKLWGIGKVA